jgi:hypothetical protein
VERTVGLEASDRAPIVGFIDFLRQRGFVVGIDRYSRLLSVVDRLGPDCSPADLKTIICPLVATSASEQDQFHQLFDAYFPHFATSESVRGNADEAFAGATRPAPQHAAGILVRRSHRTMWIALSAMVVASIALVWFINGAADRTRASSVEPPAAPSQPIAATTAAPDAGAPVAIAPAASLNSTNPQPSSEPNVGLFALLGSVGVLLLFVAAEWRANRRRQVLLERQRNARPPLTWPVHSPGHADPYANRAEIHSVARGLRAREASDAHTLNIDRTIDATIGALGFPTFRYTPLTRPPEYVILIERASPRDHQAELFRSLIDALAHEGVHVVAYSYIGDPRVCRQDNGTSLPLTEVRKRHPDHRLLMFGSGDGLVDPITGRLLQWVPQLLSWKDRAILTPRATSQWASCESVLAAHFIVLPATVASLGAVVQAFAWPAVPSARWLHRGAGRRSLSGPKVVDALREYLGERMVQWICACALYPEVQWDLTLALTGVSELGSELLSETNFIELVRLPWFREGAMPDDVRRSLLDALDPRIERAARTKIVELLEKNPAPAGSVAYDGHALDLAVQRISLSRHERERRAELRRVLRNLPDRQLTRDVALLRLAEQAPTTGVALILPQRLRQVFFRGGIGALGWRSGFWRRLGLAASGVAAVITSIAVATAYLAHRRFEQATSEATRDIVALAPNPVDLPPLDVLKRLDALRIQVDTLSAYEHGGTRVGRVLLNNAQLYAQARRDYFAAFSKLMFAQTRVAMLGTLRNLPDAPRPTDDYGDTYNLLKAYLITTSHPDKSTTAFLAPALMMRWLGSRSVDSARATLARRQFETYANELRYANPFPDTADVAAVEKGRSFLRKFAGSEHIYQYMLAEASKSNPAVQFNKSVAGSAPYVTDSYEVPGSFTKGGAAFMLSAFKTVDKYLSREPWVVGEDASGMDKAKLVADLQTRYSNDYTGQWRKFLSSAQVARYNGVKDAAAKLAVLSGNQSPLLALFSIVSENTAVGLPEVARTFQPVQVVTPPAVTDKLIGDKNAPYMNALLTLQSSLDQTANAQGPAAEQAAGQAATNATAARTAARQIAAGFNVDQQGQVHTIVQNLLEAPVAHAEPLLRSFGADEINIRARTFCSAVQSTLAKYPFAPDATTQASLAEVTALIRPNTGSLWKFYNDALAGIVPKQGTQYVAKPDASTKIAPSFVMLLNRAQAFADALFKSDSPDPHLSITVQPMPGDAFRSVSVSLDGEVVRSSANGNTETARIDWPGAQHEAKLSAGNGGPELTMVGPYSGPWAVFQLFGAADDWKPAGNAFLVGWELATRTQRATTARGTAARITVQVDAGTAALVLRKGFFAGTDCTGNIAQ